MDNSEQIINAYMPLIKANARKFSRFDYDETIDESRMLAIEAIGEYDGSKGSFGNFLKLKLKYYYLDKSKLEPMGSLDDLDSNGEAIVDTLEDDYDFEMEFLEKEEYKNLYEAINRLKDGERQIIIYKYFYDMSIDDIAKKMGLSYKTVANKTSLALKDLRKTYNIL
ncbi:sigma-70 family RNA polymerase sigma factor [uncultured Anaerococcus sp.]|uniref:sigma-70 family RNA polymerase sigma factor n=1 Tax=uncultured Anaerococcus sp. TaxID=293428 RepID=UPI00260F5D94|nr:sigma-70 family RNA polymerase sigma factor [uncultured Anaerococcus sp.]